MHWFKFPLNLYKQFFVFFFTMLLTCSYVPSAQATSASKSAEAEIKDKALLISSVAAFKETARTDYAKALLAFSKGRGMERLHEIDKSLWEASQAQLGWMLFFNGAVVAYAGIDEKSPIAGLYNPYSDTFLITVWARDKNSYKVVDAEMLMGDWIRSDNKDLDIMPLWLRGTMHRPVTVGLSVAKTLLSFEKVFAASTSKNWRRKLAMLSEQDILDEINTPSMVIMMNSSLLNLLRFAYPEANEDLLKACKKRTLEVMKLTEENKLDVLFSVADETLPQTAQSLKTYPKEWFSSLKVVNARVGAEGCLVFLSPPQQTNRSLSLFFQGTKSIYLRPKRIDLIDYQFFYNELKRDPTKGNMEGIR